MASWDRFCRLTGSRIPILQAPTGSIAGPELAAAVAGAGAVGSLGLTWTAPAEAAEHARAVREATGGPFAANFALAFAPCALGAVLAAGAPIVVFSWGDPSPWMAEAGRAGAVVGAQVADAGEAIAAVGAGARFVICQGTEAGGHVQARLALSEALPRVVAAVGASVPVLAAGGIVDGQGIAGALRLGAEGVVMGTRFVATRESRAHDGYRRLLIGARGADATALTTCFDGGWPSAPHRVLRNSTLSAWEAAGGPGAPHRPGEGDVLARSMAGDPILRYEDTAPRRGMVGDLEAMALYSGSGVGGIRDIPPAGALVARLWREALDALALGEAAG